MIHLPKDGRTALFELRRHCAPLTLTHVENTEYQFRNLQQHSNEPATFYFSRIRQADRDCYHAGIPNTKTQNARRSSTGAIDPTHTSATTTPGVDTAPSVRDKQIVKIYNA